jgi:hypothetical protein
MLLLTFYPQAVKIALETKKYLVDNNLQDVTQVGSQQQQEILPQQQQQQPAALAQDSLCNGCQSRWPAVTCLPGTEQGMLRSRCM